MEWSDHVLARLQRDAAGLTDSLSQAACHLPGMGRRRVDRKQVLQAGQRMVSRGERPVYRVRLDEPSVVELPWLEFRGSRPFETLEAARRAIAAELGVRPDQIEVEAEA